MSDSIEFYAGMLLLRRAEQRLAALFSNGTVPGFVHLGLGQEAVPVGVCSVLSDEDTVASTHRGHGHALAKQVGLDRFFAEILGRATGLCAGRGGSMHVADMSVGMLGANGIVGGGLGIALGSAVAHQVKGSGGIAVAFFGDGAMAEGALHECLNLAVLWKLPLLFVCENNGWSEFSATSEQFRGTLSALSAAFGIRSHTVDGQDVRAVARVSQAAAAAARTGGGPQVVECMTQRWDGHYAGDPQKYRDPENRRAARDSDPLEVEARYLEASGIDAGALERVRIDIDQRIEAAVRSALAAPEPEFAAAARDVYAVEASNG
ncbi:MAG: thiamine pyrophosphate-dependent dehydrogenase E1 component subunit alpha [Lautropia sp.]